MTNHECGFIIDFDTEGDGDPIFCGDIARWKLGNTWLCTEHYDMVMNDYHEDEA